MKTISFRIPYELEMKLCRTIDEITKTTPPKEGLMSEIVRKAIERECNRIMRELKRKTALTEGANK